MERTIKLATCIFTFLALLSEGLTMTSPPLLPASKRADWNSGQNCPPIIPSTSNHSTWLPVVHEGQDFHAWQQYTTTGYAKDLYAAWVRQPSALDCSQFNITTVVTDIHTINTSIAVLDTRVDKNCSDEGIYLVLITSNCTFNDSIMFNMTFDKNDPCTKAIPPQPEIPKSVTVPEHQPDANESTTLCVSIRYFGSDNISRYDTLWLLGEKGSCNEMDPNLLCADDGTDELGSVYTCNRVIFGDCTFLSDICISNYSRLNSGKYTTIACPVSGSDPIGSISQLELSVIGWPKLTKWPGSMVSPTVDEMEANLTYGLTNFSHNFINITFYNGSELIANLTHFAEGFKVLITGEDNESTTIQLSIPAEGRYKMCYNFTDDVQWTGQSNFPPGYEVPNCTQYTHAIPREGSTSELWLAFLSILAVPVILIIFGTVGYNIYKHKKSQSERSTPEERVHLKDEDSSTPYYGGLASNKADSGKVEVKDQQIPVDITGREHKHVQAESITPLPQTHLRGVNVIAKTTLTLTQKSQYHELKGYGFKLHVPEGSLPAEISETKLNVQVSLSGQFQMPPDCELLSAVYWVYSPHKFIKALTVEIQHCAVLSCDEQCAQLTFVSTKCTQKEPPYVFKLRDQGIFSHSSSYGSLSLSHFSGHGVAKCRDSRRSRRDQPYPPTYMRANNHQAKQLVSRKLTVSELSGAVENLEIVKHDKEILVQYCGQVYICKELNDYTSYFVIVKNLDAYRTIVKESYSMKSQTEVSLGFDGKAISLSVPKNGTVLESGWKIKPCHDPIITKEDVDNFKDGQRIPKCKLLLRWLHADRPHVYLEHDIDLNGAKGCSFITLHIPDAAIPSPALQPSLSSSHLTPSSPSLPSSPPINSSPPHPPVLPSPPPPSFTAATGSGTAHPRTGLDLENVNGTTVLGEDDRQDVVSAVVDLAGRWQDLGSSLGVCQGDFDHIYSASSHSPSECLRKMIISWLKQSYDVNRFGKPTWRRLVEAVEDRVGGNYPALAQRIAKKYPAHDALPTAPH